MWNPLPGERQFSQIGLRQIRANNLLPPLEDPGAEDRGRVSHDQRAGRELLLLQKLPGPAASEENPFPVQVLHLDLLKLRGVQGQP